MKGCIFLSVLMSLILLIGGNAFATFNSGSTGADGAFNPTTNTELQLPVDGVFNFTTVNIPSGVTVTFKKNAANTPVYILASGDVLINGTIDVSGQSATNSTVPGRGGPGGYDGGNGAAGPTPGGMGLGPGGGAGGYVSCYWGAWTAGGGGFGTNGGKTRSCGSGGPSYGNAILLPLIGGSGGGGSSNDSNYGTGGGGGGGAILIASSGTITITGSIISNGGQGCYLYNSTGSGSGSGGAIKLVANVINGSGTIAAREGAAFYEVPGGGKGRIRLEAYTNSFAPSTDPPYSLNIYSTSNPPGSVFLSHEPILRIDQIAGVTPPTRTGSYAQPDIFLPSTTTNPVTVNLSAAYIPSGTTVTVSVIPQYGSTSSNVNTTLSGVLESTTASANVDLSTQYSNVIMAQATYTMQQAMYYDNEKIEKVRVAAAMGKESETVYITESGKEIPAKVLKLAGLIK